MPQPITPAFLKNFIKAEAFRLGFVACGVSSAEPVPVTIRNKFNKQLMTGGVGDMSYLLRNEDVRFNPSKLLEGAKSIIVLAFNYYPPVKQNSSVPQVAFYAYGKDYHRVLKDKLFQLLERIRTLNLQSFKARPFVDSAPLMERYWAQKAGIGKQGRNGLIIVPGYGSFCFLSEIVTTLELPPDEATFGSPCGKCSRCIEMCPAKAIQMDGTFLATQCLSYQTIEHKGEITDAVKKTMDKCLFGCDICQTVCPHNQRNTPHHEDAFLLPEWLRNMPREDWERLSPEMFEKLFRGSAILRAGYEGIQRNLEALTEFDDE